MSLAEQITRHMGGSWHGNYGTYPGDGHSRKDRSVSIKDAPDKPERVLIHCHAGDDWRAEMDRLRRAGFVQGFEPRKPVEMRFGPRSGGNDNAEAESPPADAHAVKLGRGQRIVATFDYHDASGNIAYRNHRIEPGDNPGDNKTFRADHPDGKGGWLPKAGDAPKVPYRLADLIASRGPIYMVEGEAKADKLARWGFTATSLKNWQAAFAPFIAGRIVFVLPDNDTTGGEQAARAKAHAEKAGCTVHTIELPGLPLKGDILDWKGTPEELTALAVKAARGAAITATPFAWPDPASIPRRRWLFGHWLLRGEITAVIAPSGVGKSTITTAIKLSLASGTAFLGKDLPEGPRAVWLWNLEDDRDELNRQVTACAIRHGTGPTECGNRLYVDSGLDQRLCTAIEGPNGLELIEPVYDNLKAEIIARGIDVLTIDPFVSSHEIDENANVLIDKVVKRWKRLAHETGCAIVLVHHTKKMGGREVRAEDSRGAVALIAAARIVLTINTMTADEAERFGIKDKAERLSLVRIDNDKANRSPPENATWFKKESVSLGNGDGLKPSDFVGAAVPWSPPDPFDGISTRDLYNVQLAIDSGDYRDSSQAADWAGVAVAEVLGFDLEDKAQKERVKSLLKTWKANGAFAVEPRKVKGEDRPFLAVKGWVDPATLPTPKGGVGKGGEGGDATPTSHPPHPTFYKGGWGGGGVTAASEIGGGEND